MTKAELIEAIVADAKEGDVASKAQVTRIVNAAFGKMSDALAKGEAVSIANFVNFKVVEKAERVSRNPQTGEKITIPAKKVVKATATKALKEAVNK